MAARPRPLEADTRRILLVSLVFAPDGVSTAFLMADLARALQARGHAITVLTTVPHYNFDADSRARQPLRPMWFGLLRESTIGGIRVIHVPVRSKGQRVVGRLLDHLYFHILSTLAGVFAVGQYDVVLAPSPPLTMGLHGWLLARIRGAPFVYNVQEIYPDAAVSLGAIKPSLLLRILQRTERFIYARARVITVISQRFAERLARKGVPREKIRVIENFNINAEAEGDRAAGRFQLRDELGDAFVVLYAGNLGLTQDLETILAAADRLRARSDVVFLIVGDGARRNWLEGEIATRASTNVRLLPYQPSSVMADLYASSHVGLVPLKREMAYSTFPSKVYSIMAAGRPVLATAEPDTELSDLVSRAGCGFVISPEDPATLAATIEALVDRRGHLAEIGARGRAYVRDRHTVTRAAAQYHELIRELPV